MEKREKADGSVALSNFTPSKFECFMKTNSIQIKFAVGNDDSNSNGETPFDWGKGGDRENRLTPCFCDKLGVSLATCMSEQKLRLLDIHTRNSTMDGEVGGMSFRGRTDLVITSLSQDTAMASDAIITSKMIFELKTDDLTPEDQRQVIGELMCGLAKSEFMVEACLTNGAKWD